MMTTEELDALDALLREQDGAAHEANEAYRNSWPHSGGDDFLAKQNAIHTTLVRSTNADTAVRDAAGSNFKTLLSAARQAETLRAKLAETEQARHEARFYGNQVAAERDNLQSRLNQAEHAAKMLTTERDALKAQRDELREAADDFIDWLPQHTYRPPNDTAIRFLSALEAAR